MIRLNRTTEYGLMSLRHMYRAPDARVSAREIAGTYGLPFEITAKTLQRLKEHGFIRSEQGAKGGYTLNRALDQVSLAEFLEEWDGHKLLSDVQVIRKRLQVTANTIRSAKLSA